MLEAAVVADDIFVVQALQDACLLQNFRFVFSVVCRRPNAFQDYVAARAIARFVDYAM